MQRSGSAAVIVREGLSFATIAAACFALLSLWTYQAGDLAEAFYPPTASVLNRGGAIGALLGSELLLWMGAIAPSLMALLLLYTASRAFLGKPIGRLWYRLPAAGVLVLSVCTIEAMLGQTRAAQGLLEGTLPGGIYGVHLAGLLQPALGAVPSLLLVGTAGTLAVLGTAGGVPSWARPLASLAGKVGALIRVPRLFLRLPASPNAVPLEEAVGVLPSPVDLSPEPVEVEVEEPAGGPTSDVPEEDDPSEEDGEGADTQAVGDSTEMGDILPVITAAPTMETEAITVAESPEEGEFVLPPLSLLEPAEEPDATPDDILREQAETLRRTLASFKVMVRVSEIQPGPAITLFELELAPGTKASKIVGLSDDLAMALKTQGIRVVYPLPNKSTVGIEVPNRTQEVVRLRELIESDTYRKRKMAIPLLIGKNTRGEPLVKDLAKLPHILIAGQTGAGKSVCLNSIILSLLFTRKPSEVRMILIDPKQVELMAYENLPHLLTPVVTDMKKAPAVLKWVVSEMERRYERMASVGVRHITSYNALGAEEIAERLSDKLKDKGLDHPMPYIVVVVDELGDLMITASRDVEESIIRLAQKSRAVGIHVVLATQRPSADVLTGLIKSNLPSRIAFQVAGRVDSRTILDRNGAEKLQGSGDLLYLSPGESSPVRCQGTYVSDSEIRRAVSTIRRAGSPEFDSNLGSADAGALSPNDVPEDDDLYERAVQIIVETGRGSASLLQRRLEIGYTRASRLIDMMDKRGVVGPHKGSKAREILITLEEWEAMKSDSEGDA